MSMTEEQAAWFAETFANQIFFHFYTCFDLSFDHTHLHTAIGIKWRTIKCIA